MGRTIYADSSLQAYLDTLIDRSTVVAAKSRWNIGLIVGQQSSVLQAQKDYVIRLVKTPHPSEDMADVEVDDGRRTENAKSIKIYSRPESLDKTDVAWMASHAKQVVRMLPGGLDVIGIYAVAPSKMLKASQLKLRQIMFAVHKELMRGQIARKATRTITDRVILQICTQTKKLTCKTLDVSDHKSTLRPADWKYQAILDRFVRLESRVNVDFESALTKNSTRLSLYKQMEASSEAFCRRMLSALATVNGKIRRMDDPLDRSPLEKRTKPSKEDKGKPPVHQKYNIDLFLSATDKNNNVEFPTVTECGAKVHTHGAVTCRAFVHGKATVREAVNAMKTDVIRTLMSRVELLCEDIDVTEEDRDYLSASVYDTPKRVFAEIPGYGITFCDYAFQDETVEEITGRYSELLDLTVPAGSLKMDEEIHLSIDSFARTRELAYYNNGSGDQGSEASIPAQISETISQISVPAVAKTWAPSLVNLRVIGTLAVGAVAMVSAGLAYLFSVTESDTDY